MGALGQDLATAGRRLAHSPVFSLTAMLIVAVGIGASTAVFTAVDTVLFRPPPFDEPDRVVRVYQDSEGGPGSFSYPMVRDVEASSGVFAALSAVSPQTLTWESSDGLRPLRAEFATTSVMEVVGREPALGRWFTPAEDRPGAGHYAVLGHRLWRTAFGSDPAVLGRTILAGCGLLTRSLVEAQRIDPGVRAEGVAFLRPAAGRVPTDRTEAGLLVERVRERIAALPGVEAVALTTRLPLSPGPTSTVAIEGYRTPDGQPSVEVARAVVTRDYFRLLGVAVRRGRTFAPGDGDGGERVVIVNEAAARRYWQGGEAVGGRVGPPGVPEAASRVVGVVADYKVGSLKEAPTPMLFQPAGAGGTPYGIVLARTRGDPVRLAKPMRTALSAAAPSMSTAAVGTLDEHVGRALVRPRLATALLGASAAVATCLASLGVYAVVSFTVAGRRAEMAVRLALGAEPRRLAAGVVGRALSLVAVGLGAGLGVWLGVAGLAAPALAGFLFGVSAEDPTAFAASAVALLLVAGAAAWIPARRAARTDPVAALGASKVTG